MDRQVATDSESRFVRYVEGLTSVIGYADRTCPLRDYCVGLVATEGRKSVEPMAAVTAPAEVSAQHQKMLHFVSNSPWSDEPVLAKVRELVVPQIERHGPIKAWIIDDTSFPKQGKHSVGVEHQYCGELGKQANCQVSGDAVDRQSMPVCRSPMDFICRRAGRKTESAATRRVFQRRSSSRPSHRSRLNRCRRLARRACDAVSR
jgi:SRSO17 transposase